MGALDLLHRLCDNYAMNRRRSPGWVRSMSSRQLHGLCMKLDRARRHEGISDRQEWLWDCAVSELEYRHRREPNVWKRCVCQLCLPPFPWPDEVELRDDELELE